jgi:flavin-dependent dehydrogenase
MIHYDIVIVGARCAGASLATHLARRGAKTLVLEASALPSDHVLSTHFVHAPGMDVLDELGVGARVRAAAPATEKVLLSVDDSSARIRNPPGRAGYCIRRIKLDTWLQEAAAGAGAEIRDRSRVVGLERRGERVSGVRVETPSGSETIHADFVVGADGAQSTIAKLTGVEEYLGFDSTRGGYWSYWPAPACWKSDERFAFDALFAYKGDGLWYVFQTDDELLVLVGVPPAGVARSFGREYREKHIEYLRSHPMVAPLVEHNAPVGKIAGYLSGRYFYRRPVGPGFALVGDAGQFKDYVTGHGITDALISAKRLSEAILDGGDMAMARYWRERDAKTVSLFLDAQRMGEVGFNDALTRLIIRKVGESTELAERLALVFDRKLSPFDVVGSMTIARWVLGEAIRGRFEAIGPFFDVGRRLGRFHREVELREELFRETLAEIDASSHGAPPQLKSPSPEMSPVSVR